MKKVFFILVFFIIFKSPIISQGTGNINPDEVAKLHNEYLFKAMNSITKLTDKDVRSIVLNFDIKNMTVNEKIKLIDLISSVNIDKMKELTINYLKDDKAKDYYNQIDLAIDNSNNFNELNLKISKIIELINLNLNDTDWDILMTYAKTVIASADYWYPKNYGGNGTAYTTICGQNMNIEQRVLPGWAKADGRGAGYAMASWGLLGGLGGPAGLGGTALLGAVFSSLDYGN